MFDNSKDHYDSKVKYDEDTKKFKELKIFLNFKEHSYSNLKQNMKTIIHELDHAYKDCESYVNNEEFHLYNFAKPGTRYYKSAKWDNDFKNDYAKKLFYIKSNPRKIKPFMVVYELDFFYLFLISLKYLSYFNINIYST